VGKKLPAGGSKGILKKTNYPRPSGGPPAKYRGLHNLQVHALGAKCHLQVLHRATEPGIASHGLGVLLRQYGQQSVLLHYRPGQDQVCGEREQVIVFCEGENVRGVEDRVKVSRIW